MDVVFEDNRVAYQPSVNTNPETTQEKLNPSGKGNIGLFAGYIQSGNFVNCSSVGENSVGYHFLGTAVATGKEAISASHYDTVQYSEEQLKAMVPGTLKEVYGENSQLQPDDLTRYIFPLKLENCRFLLGAMEHLQVIGCT